MNIAIILAGGVGARVGAGVPKQFIEVLGKPIMAYTLEKFQNNANIDAIEIVCLASHEQQIKDIVTKYGITKTRWYTHGGDTFQKSTMNGITNLKGKIAADDIVLIGFAVAPLVSDEILDDCIRVCKQYGNAVPADDMIMCTCIRDADGLGTTKGIVRETLAGFNGPWTFKFGDVLSAYETAVERGILDSIEPHTTSLMLELGHKIYFAKSATTNIKITKKEDLDIFEGLLLLEQKRKGLL